MKNQLKALALLAAIAIIPSQSAAERLITCPIGGIKTRVPEITFNCVAAITMELSLNLGCTFRDEVLPLCKSADFPIYKDFLVNDVAGLKKLV